MIDVVGPFTFIYHYDGEVNDDVRTQWTSHHEAIVTIMKNNEILRELTYPATDRVKDERRDFINSSQEMVSMVSKFPSIQFSAINKSQLIAHARETFAKAREQTSARALIARGSSIPSASPVTLAAASSESEDEGFVIPPIWR